MSLVVRTLADRIFDLVREKVVSGQLAEDQPIRQDALAAEFGVSKIPLREALARLEQENLLVSHANRGYFVRAMTADEAEEIYALRLAIEPAAVGLAALAATDEERAAAVAAMQALDQAASTQAEQVAVRNREFHVALTRPCRRVLTMQLIERLQILSERYTVAHLAPPAGAIARMTSTTACCRPGWRATRPGPRNWPPRISAARSTTCASS
jgi:DNA-binding GntR family transcriptional regulator